MISVTELRSGTIFEDQDQLFQVLSYEHIKMGRGSATIKVKVRNVRTGSTTGKSFISGARIQDIHVEKRPLQYLYKDEVSAYFMDPSTFEQMHIPLSIIPEHPFLKEGESFSVNFIGSEALSVALAPKMEFKVVETGPSLKGNSATNIYKDAVLENGLKTKVPLFIKEGDSVRIDTRDGSYSEKV